MLSLPRETFFSATGTRPIIKLLYKISSGTMINTSWLVKMTPSASLQHKSGRYNHPAVNKWNLFSLQQRYLHNDNSTTRNPQKYVSPCPISFIQVLALSSMLLPGRFCAPLKEPEWQWGCSLETARINVMMPVTYCDCPSAEICSAQNRDKVTCWCKRWGNILNRNSTWHGLLE